MGPEDKIGLPQDLANRLPRPLVMTKGVFDVLHRGHVSYLHRATELGSSLLVAVNTYRSARMRGNGPDRPLNAAEDRAYVLAGLESVAIPFVDGFSTTALVQRIRKPHLATLVWL